MSVVCIGIRLMSLTPYFTETLFFYGYMNLSSSGQMPVMEEVDTSERLETYYTITVCLKMSAAPSAHVEMILIHVL